MLIEVLLAALLAAALVLAIVRAVAGPAVASWAGRLDALAIWAAVLVPSSLVFGSRIAGPAVLAVLGVIALWFAYRAAVAGPVPAPAAGSKSTATGGSPRAAAIYHLVLTAAAAWAAVSLTGALGPHPAHQQLGSLIQHVIMWIVLLISCAGWLLSAFATLGNPSERPSRVTGTFEALLAAALAACFFTLS